MISTESIIPRGAFGFLIFTTTEYTRGKFSRIESQVFSVNVSIRLYFEDVKIFSTSL